MTRLTAGASSGASGGLPDHDLMFEHDPVGVVEDLGLVAELDGSTEAALGDRAGVAVVQAHSAGGAVRNGPDR